MQKKERLMGLMQDHMSIGTLYSFLFCMMASNVLLSFPMLGGAMYLTGQITLLLLRHGRGVRQDVFPVSMRRLGTALLVVVLLVMIALMAVHPIGLENMAYWQLFLLVLCIILRQGLAHFSLEKSLVEEHTPMKRVLLLAAVQGAFLLPPLLALLLSGLERDVVWSLLGGFASCGLLECFSLGRVRGRLRQFSQEALKEAETLQSIHAYRIYQHVLLVTAAAVQVTLVLTYTYIAATEEALIVCMLIALLCTYATGLVTQALLRRSLAKGSDPSFMVLGGLVIWLYGLILFVRSLDELVPGNGYISLALCTVGASTCVRMLSAMMEDMRRVAAFGMGHAPEKGVEALMNIRVDFASLMGQVVALIGLMLICVFTGPGTYGDGDALLRSFSPLLTLPALLLVLAALIFALLFPMTKQHMEKLRRYMELQKEGRENAALHEQLEAVVVRRSLRRYGIKILLCLIRPFYFHRIRGKENIQLDKETPCIFVCNHGEIYGPIVTNLYVPFSFRPWSAYEMLDLDAVAERTLNGTMANQKVLPPKMMRWVMYRVIAPLLVWAMKSVEAIPVYHDNPRMLRQTFRETVAAMEAGDNILIFPENAATSEDHKYVKEGVSEFFTGFAMVGPLYYNKTGKCPLFVPLYADKRKRTITFGTPTRFDADAPVNEEKERLCAYLRGEMLRIAGMKTE